MATKAKTKVKRRPHNRKPIVQLDDKGVLERRNAAVIAFDRAFRIALPAHEGSGQHARSGNYTQVEGDKFDGVEYQIADGTYRVAGSDWLFTFEGGGFVEAAIAQAPDFGGSKVIAIHPAAPQV